MDYELIKEALRRIYRTTAIFSSNFDYPGYTFNEMNILGTIARHPGIIAQHISEYKAIDRGYLSKILKKLEQNGLITRVQAGRPPFEKLLYVTETGRKTYLQVEEMVDKCIEDHLSVVSTAEERAFFKCVEELSGYMEDIIPDYSTDEKIPGGTDDMNREKC